MSEEPTPPAQEISVRCAFDKMVALPEIKPNPRNPNTHPPGQLDLLAKIIEHQGWRAPILVSKLSGLIVSGHGRYEAALILGVESAPVNFQDFDSEEDEFAHLVADNRLAEISEMDTTSLKELLIEMDTGAIDMDLTGFTESDLEELMTQFHVPEDNQQLDEEKMGKTETECPKCGFKW